MSGIGPLRGEITEDEQFPEALDSTNDREVDGTNGREVDQPRETGALLRDERADSIATYRLDSPSQFAARELGRRLASRAPESLWATKEVNGRSATAEFIAIDCARELGIRPRTLAFDATIDGYGSLDLDRGLITIHEQLLHDDDPRELIMTIAHETRHAWQQDVISGAIRHPAGEEQRRKLARASEAYQADLADFGAYLWNELERDSEKFADVAYREYTRQER